MDRRKTCSLILAGALTMGLAFGCAKKPTPSPEPAQPEAAAPMATGPQGIEETPVTETPVIETAPSREETQGLLRVYFDFDQYVLTAETKGTLQANAGYLKNHPGVQVLIEGHADERGSDEYNLALGERRALAVKNYLVSLGVNGGSLSIISYGEERPLDPRQSEEAWAKNRRAEFVVR